MQLYLEPMGGLCNRMRVIASAYTQLKAQKGKIFVKWVAAPELNCPSRDLFTLPSRVVMVDVSQSSPLQMKLSYYFFRLARKKHLTDDVVRSAKKAAGGTLALENRTYYETCESFQDDFEGIDFRIFSPNPRLKQLAADKIRHISQDGQHPVMSMHIRRTDNCVSIQDSPTELFCQILDAWLLRDPSVRFYIATDDPTVREFFSGKYNTGSEIVFFNDSEELSRDSREGIEAAFVELLTLSMTGRIYGSSGSSYSEVAAALGNTTLERVTKDTIGEILRQIG